MKYNVVNLKNEKVSQTDLNDRIWGCDVRRDIISRVIRWQQARFQQGTHKTRTVSEISGTTKKPFRQKGTGNARQGSLRSVQMRGGAVAHGPITRSHSHKLQKKVRNFGLRSVLSDKLKSGDLFIADTFELKDVKTKMVKSVLDNFEAKSVLIVDTDIMSGGFVMAAANLKHVDALAVAGLNVYDIAKHDKVIIAQQAIAKIEERL